MRLLLLVSPLRTALILGAIALFLTLLSVLAHGLQYFNGPDSFTEVVRQFNISGEGNLPTWFKSVMLFYCAALLGTVAAAKRQERSRFATHWLVLSFVFVFLSIDEIAQVHETATHPISALRHTGGLFMYIAWGLPVAALALIVAVAYIRFLAALPTRTRVLFIASGAVYVTGAFVLDEVNTYLWDYYYNQVLLRGFFAMLEEFTQMVGTILFIYTLLSFMPSVVKEVVIQQVAPEVRISEYGPPKGYGPSKGPRVPSPGLKPVPGPLAHGSATELNNPEPAARNSER